MPWLKPNSSKKYRRLGSTCSIFCWKTSRASRTSGRSCSLARIVFFSASSGKSVGVFGLGQTTKCMEQRDPDGIEFPIPEGFSGHQFHSCVEPLDDAGRILLLGAEVVEDQVAVRLQHLRLGLHRLDATAHGHVAPAVEEPSRPDGRHVAPEVVEVLLEDVRAGGL